MHYMFFFVENTVHRVLAPTCVKPPRNGYTHYILGPCICLLFTTHMRQAPCNGFKRNLDIRVCNSLFHLCTEMRNVFLRDYLILMSFYCV